MLQPVNPVLPQVPDGDEEDGPEQFLAQTLRTVGNMQQGSPAHPVQHRCHDGALDDAQGRGPRQDNGEIQDVEEAMRGPLQLWAGVLLDEEEEEDEEAGGPERRGVARPKSLASLLPQRPIGSP